MPIIGLTDRGVAFPEIGHIRKGGKKKPDRPGEDLHYFRIELDEREKEATELLLSTYGNEPAELPVILPFDDIDRVWDAWREAYVAGALTHRCDGEYIVYAINSKTGETVIRSGLDVKGQRMLCQLKNYEVPERRCKPTGRLKVIVPVLKRMAYLTVHTTSMHDIANISSQLAAIKELNHGHIAGVPLVLRRRPVEISTPSGKNGQRARREKWLISIEADPEWVARSIDAMRLAAMPEVARQALPAPEGPDWSGMDEFDEPERNGLDSDEYNQENFWADVAAWNVDRPTALEALNDAGGHWGTARDILKKQQEEV